MNDRRPPEEFTDVNKVVGEEWESEKTPYERIRDVIAHTYSPISAEMVADDARTAPKTARNHLNPQVFFSTLYNVWMVLF